MKTINHRSFGGHKSSKNTQKLLAGNTLHDLIHSPRPHFVEAPHNTKSLQHSLPRVVLFRMFQHPPFKEPQIPSNRDHKALNRGTLGGLGFSLSSKRFSAKCDPKVLRVHELTARIQELPGGGDAALTSADSASLRYPTDALKGFTVHSGVHISYWNP